MDLSQYTLEDVILSALKAEIEASEVYRKLSNEVPNAFLRSRLLFLSDEEDKHRAFMEKLYSRNFPDKKIVVPETTPVPMAEIKTGSGIPTSDVFQSAMDAEMDAHDYYKSMAGLFPEDKQVKNSLEYLATMEMGHYRMLELEREEMLRMEDFDMGWELMHAGP